MNEQKLIGRMTGYKATDAQMRCQGFQYELGKWYEHDGPIAMCKSGFHFCKYQSGPYSYYNDSDARLFTVEAEQVLNLPVTPGADYKLVCKRIRLVQEITPTGSGNTGSRNTGYGNTGDGNTGYGNTGSRNTGYGNTGDGNTGSRNTGYGNTGDGNTGSGNTGYGNTGYGNTGYGNTGYGNTANYSSGFFCSKEPRVICFDKLTRYTREQFTAKFPEYYGLLNAVTCSDPIEFEPYKRLPGITRAKLKKLHQQHMEGRKP